MWYVEREWGMSILFVAKESKSELIPESYSSWCVGISWELKIMRYSSGSYREGCAACILWGHQKAQEGSIWALRSFMPSSLSHLSFLHFWKCSSLWQPYEECDFYFNCWASVWDWDLLCACNGKKLTGRLPPPFHSSPLSLAGRELCEGRRPAAAWLCFLLWSLQTWALCLCVRENEGRRSPWVNTSKRLYLEWKGKRECGWAGG